MSDRRHLIVTALVSLLVLVVGCALLVWPARSDTRETRREIARLEQKIASLADAADTVDRLSVELEETREHASRLKIIPPAPDVAELMRKLSMAVDGRHVLDQTFTAGSAHPAVPGEEAAEQAMPLTVDMQASFDSVFALLRLSESMDRLVRVGSVHLISGRARESGGMRDAEPTVDGSTLAASVGLEVIYEPPDAGEDR